MLPNKKRNAHQYVPLNSAEDNDGHDQHVTNPKSGHTAFNAHLPSLRTTALILMTCAFFAVPSAFVLNLRASRPTSLPPTRGWSLGECKSQELLDSMQLRELSFGTKEEYMTLDHEYDPLWTGDLQPAGAVVSLLGQLKGADGSGVGAVSM
jgi:hypothetical protein